MYMEIDINRLLDLNYLNEFISRLNLEIDTLRGQFVNLYDLDNIRTMDVDSIIKLFDKYDCSCENIIQLSNSVFIDSAWEFADLFQADIDNSSNMKEELVTLAQKEIDKLNEKIVSINNEYKESIFLLSEKLTFVNAVYKLVNSDGYVLDEDIVNLNTLINESNWDDSVKFKFSLDLVQLLIGKIKVISKKIEEEPEVSLFETMLDEVYTTSESDNLVYETLTEPIYSETVLAYYKQYKHLFDAEGLGNDLGEIMTLACSLSSEAIVSSESMTKEHFCIKLAALLYELNQIKRGEKVEHDEYADIMFDLDKLEKIYNVDNELITSKNELYDTIQGDLVIIDTISESIEFKEKIKNKLRLIQIELKNNLISSSRKEKLYSEYNEIKKYINKLPEVMKQLNVLRKFNTKIVKMLAKKDSEYGYITEEYYNDLNNLQQNILELIDKVGVDGPIDYMSDVINNYERIVSKYLRTSKKVELKSFVLFEIDKTGEPYVVSDLDFHNRNNLIDEGTPNDKLGGAFHDYSTLIKDLLVYGVPGCMKDGTPAYIEKILSNVNYDNDRNYPTGMVRIRPTRNSLVRFISQKVVLHTNTRIHEQVVSILQEVIPNVKIDHDKDFSLYLNFASSIKSGDFDSYEEAIKRYSRHGLLYKLFLSDDKKVELTEEECSMLRDIINLSLDAYLKLEKDNKYLEFDIVNQIGGKKKHG